MVQRDVDKLLGEYQLFERYATRYSCMDSEQLCQVEKEMYSNHIVDSFQKMSVDDLIFIYARFKELNEKFKLLYSNNEVCGSMEKAVQIKNDDIYRKYATTPNSLIPEEDFNAYTNSQLYWLDKIKNLLSFNRYVSPAQAEHILDFCSIMETKLHSVIITKMGKLSEEELNEEEEYLNSNLTEVSLKAVKEGITDWDKYPEYEIAGKELYYFNKIKEKYNDYGLKRV